MKMIFATTAVCMMAAGSIATAQEDGDWDSDKDGMMSMDEAGAAYPNLTLAEWNDRDGDKDGKWSAEEMEGNSDDDEARWRGEDEDGDDDAGED